MPQKRKILLLSIAILLVSQAFMIALATNSFEKLHVASELTSYAVPQKDMNRKIEAALRFGKSLDTLLGMDGLLAEYAQTHPDLKNIQVVDAGDRYLHGSRALPEGESSTLSREGTLIPLADPMLEVLETPQEYRIVLPLFGPGETWMGTSAPKSALLGSTVFIFEKTAIQEGVGQFWKKRLLLGAGIAACACVLLFFLLARLDPSRGVTPKFNRRLFFRVLLVVVLAQVVFAGLSARQFHREHVQGLQDRMRGQLELLRQEMERVLGKGVSLDRVARMDDYLTDILNSNPEVLTLRVLDESGHVYAQARTGPETNQAMPPVELEQPDTAHIQPAGDFSVTLPLRGAGQARIMGELRADLDRSTLRALIWKILLDSLTVALIASLFIVEQIYFLVSRIGARSIASDQHGEAGEKQPGRAGAGSAAATASQAAASPPVSDQTVLDRLMMARFAAFAFLFAFALPVSFVPLQMRELYVPLWGLPRDVILGLPISLEMLCALLTSLGAGALADKRGWRTPFLAGVVVTTLGLAFCALATTGGQFILARGVCGAGYGLSWMALQSFLFTNSTPTTRARGISHFVAGIFSGHICGTALGAMLAERLGYVPVFWVGTILASACILIFMLFMRSQDELPGTSPAIGRPGLTRVTSSVAPSVATPAPPGAMSAYLLNRNVFLLIFCCVIPFSICQVGLLFFATPLYLDQLGVKQSDIGRVLMIYGLSVVYLAPQISKLVDRHERKAPFIVAGGLLGGLGLSLLYLFQGFPAIIGAVFLLGLASSIGGSAQTAFALKLRPTQNLGAGKAMAIQRGADKLGQMLGPLALGALMSGVSISQGLVVLGVAYMGLSLLFLLLAREHEPAGFARS